MAAGTIEIPQAIAQDISINLIKGSANIPLPSSSTHTEGTLTEEGSVLYTDAQGEFDIEVVAGAVETRVQTIIQSADAPTEYIYEFSNTTVIINDGAGGAIAFDPSTETAPNVYIAAPWAIDANGTAVATHYEIRGSALAQIVDHSTTEVTYPVTADPTYSFGWGFYAHFNKAETKTVSRMSTPANWVVAACSAIGLAAGGPWGAAAGGAACAVAAGSILYQSTLAVNSNKCLYMRGVAAPFNTILFYPGTYHDKRCK